MWWPCGLGVSHAGSMESLVQRGFQRAGLAGAFGGPEERQPILFTQTSHHVTQFPHLTSEANRSTPFPDGWM